KAGRLISSSAFLKLQLVSDRTSEHKVFFDPIHNRAIKQTWPGQFGWVPECHNKRWSLGIAKPLDYLDRWILFNEVFGDDVRLEGIISAGPSMIIGETTETISIVISQGWRQVADLHHPTPSPEEIDVFLQKLGFKYLSVSFHGWHRAADRVILLDAR